MKRIHYAGTAFSTTDELARELVHYAEELARRGTADTVEVPGILDDGSLEMFELLIGPASQVVLGTSHQETEGLDTTASTAEIRERRLKLVPPPFKPMEDSHFDDW